MSTPGTEGGPRIRTVVWGGVLAALGGGLLAVAQGYRVDLQLAAIGLLAFAGAALLGGSLLSAFRRRDGVAGATRPAAPPGPVVAPGVPTTDATPGADEPGGSRGRA